MTHGGYIIALVVGFLTLVSKLDVFAKSLHLREFFYVMVFLMFLLGIYLSSKTIFWAIMAQTILHVTRTDFEEVAKKDDNKNKPDIFVLQSTVINIIKNRLMNKEYRKRASFSRWLYYRWFGEFSDLTWKVICHCFILAAIFAIIWAIAFEFFIFTSL
jgi:hypothetical protein